MQPEADVVDVCDGSENCPLCALNRKKRFLNSDDSFNAFKLEDFIKHTEMFRICGHRFTCHNFPLHHGRFHKTATLDHSAEPH